MCYFNGAQWIRLLAGRWGRKGSRICLGDGLLNAVVLGIELLRQLKQWADFVTDVGNFGLEAVDGSGSLAGRRALLRRGGQVSLTLGQRGVAAGGDSWLAWLAEMEWMCHWQWGLDCQK